MTQPIRTLGALALGAAIVAIAALSVRTGPVSGAPTTTDTTNLHTITVSATGKITVVPDVARVNVGVTLTKPSVKAARAAAAQAMTSVIAGIKALGIDDKDIQTTGLNLNAQYANGSSTRIVGYQISEQLQITVRDLDKAGDVVDTAVAKGATDLNGVWFEVSDPEKAQNDARAAAMASAEASAKALATGGHVTLGSVVSISDATPTFQPNYQFGRMAAAPVADVATPVQPGSQDVTSTVTVVYEID